MRIPSSTLVLLFAVAAASPGRAQEPNFGRALAVTGTELFVGQPVNWYGPGVVYTYRLAASGEWDERDRLTASDSSRKDDFGRAIAVEANRLVVGAPRKREGSGVAYVFERAMQDEAWRQAAIVEPPGTGQAGFGASLSLTGDDLLVGAPATDGTGVVYHFRRSGDSWALHATIRPPAGAVAAAFGAALSREGDRLLVGAPATASNAGAVFASRRTADGDWGPPTVITLPQPETPRAGLGATVLLAGDRAYVGAPGASVVFVLTEAAGVWTPAGELAAPDAPRGAQFGAAVATAGEEVWVGAPGLNRSNGRVYRFSADGRGAWREAVRLDADSADGTHWPFAFGYSIASAGERAVIGMPTRDFGEGRVLALGRQGEEWRPGQLLEGEIFALGRTLASGDRCEDGQLGEFPCTGIELVAHMPTSALGGERGVWVNDVWGWTDPETGRDYALVARRDGAAFVDVTVPEQPLLVGSLPRTPGSPPSVWRDIKVLNDHAYIVSDGAGAHGMQVFDLTRLRTPADSPAVFSADTTYHEIHSAHNVVADTTSGFLYVVGANGGGETCGGGLHMVDARDPRRPVFTGCYNDSSSGGRGYTHDAQCVVYRGPDERYRGRQICLGSNESELNIADVTDKSAPVALGRASYPNVAYAHQGWFDDEQRYFYMNDEADELQGTVAGTRTLVWDLARLDDPILAHEYIGPVRASDHNLYVRGDRVYESNYGSGLRVLDISDRTRPREIAFLDSAPYNEDEPGHSATESGAWSNYPFFRSGIIVFTSVREGLFIVRVTETRPIS